MARTRMILPAVLTLVLAGCATKSAEIEVADSERAPRSEVSADETRVADRADDADPIIQFGRDVPLREAPAADADVDVPAEAEELAEAEPSADPAPAPEPVMDLADDSGSGAPSAATRRPSLVAKKAEEKRRKAKEAPPVMPSTGGVLGGAPVDPNTVVPESNTEDYTDYGINGFTLTNRDALSTFAVDVDTASYTITRSKLRQGYLPPTAAVRVEEFVNYFPYEYAQPEEGHPFAVDVEAAPSPYNPANHIVRVGVQGKKVHFDTRRPVNLTFLVDVSGSMQARNKIGMVKDTLKMLTEELEDGDTVALVTYAGATKVVLKPTPISQRDNILRALGGLTAGGSTAMGAGIELAYAQADAAYRPGAVNRVIVASDGDANVGVTSHQKLSEYIAGKAQKGITLTTLGFGNGNYKDTMMERLANDGDGNYYYIDSMQESRRIFVDQLSGTLEVIAKDVKIQVEWNEDTVLAYRLIGYENRDIADKDFRNDKVDAGEIGAGHQVTALYEVALKDDLSAGLGTVRVRNKAPGPDSPAVERRYEVPAGVMATRFADATPQFRLQTAAAGFAEILRDSPHMNEVTLREVADIARGAKRVEYGEDSELVELIEIASRLKGERNVSRR